MPQKETKEIIARFFSHGKKYEILIDSGKYAQYMEGKIIDLRGVLISAGVFRDIGKVRTKEKALMAESSGVVEQVPENELKAVFGTSDFFEAAKKIISEGEVQITTEQRKAFLESKRKKIIAFISAYAIDPRTRLPHPPLRIENAIEQAKVRIDPFKRAEDQINDVVGALKPILPIRFESRKIAFKIATQYASQCRRIIAGEGKVLREQWAPDFWFCEAEIPAGLQDSIFSRLNSVTHGQVESRSLE